MKQIPVRMDEGVLSPSEPIPDNAIAVVCDGQNYTVYEPGDDLPPQPASMVMPDIQPEGGA